MKKGMINLLLREILINGGKNGGEFIEADQPGNARLYHSYFVLQPAYEQRQ